MPHILDGDWRSFVVPKGTPRDDGNFHLEINPSSGDLGGSMHNGNGVEGEVTEGSVFHYIRIHDTAEDIEYRGVLIYRGATMILCGLQDLNPGGDPVRFRERQDELESKGLFFGQEQEVWVATKP
jgi:hypothetical protein